MNLSLSTHRKLHALLDEAKEAAKEGVSLCLDRDVGFEIHVRCFTGFWTVYDNLGGFDPIWGESR